MPKLIILGVLTNLPNFGISACDIRDLLQEIRPKAQWTLSGDTLAGLKWMDKSQLPPTQDELNQACAAQVPVVSLEDRIKNLADRITKLETTTK